MFGTFFEALLPFFDDEETQFKGRRYNAPVWAKADLFVKAGGRQKGASTLCLSHEVLDESLLPILASSPSAPHSNGTFGKA